MAKIKPFRALRPTKELAARVAALPYDVYSREEAKQVVAKNDRSFLAIDRAETGFPDEVSTYAPEVYEKARELLRAWTEEGTFLREETPCYYLYALTMDGRTQTGLVACSFVDDYLNNVILKHENTRAEKELDRIHHVDRTSAQTGPIFLAYRDEPRLANIFSEVKQSEPLYDFAHEDGIRHTAWIIDDEARISEITEIFRSIPHTYIADGHHRCASAVKVAGLRREANKDYTGEEEFNSFLSVIFPASDLRIFDYNRVVADLNNFTPEAFLARISADFDVTEALQEDAAEKSCTKTVQTPYRPLKKGTFGMYLDGTWYCLKVKESALTEEEKTDPVASLDVSILQNKLLGPVLGIQDPKTDKRIDFVGGIRGLSELERRCQKDMRVAFSMYPTQMDELFAVADAARLMPPKSTWFEPKLLSGMFIHEIES